MKKFILFTTVSMLGWWTVFTVLDAFFDTSGDLLCAAAMIIPIIAVIIYFCKEKSIRVFDNTVKNLVCQLIIWNIFGAVIGCPICHLVNYNEWIVHQSSGFFMSLNGIEYFLFAFAITLEFSVLLILCKLIVYLGRLALRKK